jgi:hypothetical protein
MITTGLALLCAILANASTNEMPTLTISAKDVIQSSIKKLPDPHQTNRFAIVFQYSQEGSNRARAFTIAHRQQMVRMKYGDLLTPPGRLNGFDGRNGSAGAEYYGLPPDIADAIMKGVQKQ